MARIQLVQGGYYWAKWGNGAGWGIVQYASGVFMADGEPIQPKYISGPIMVPDEKEQ